MARPEHRKGLEPTQPLVQRKTRVGSRPPHRPARYVPNQVSLRARGYWALMAFVCTGWALIGILSGHAVVLGLGIPWQFSGLPALVFSVAVLVSGAACAVPIVDHCDRRDNEASYRSLQRQLWWAAGLLLALACAVGLGEQWGLLPSTDSRIGKLSTARLRSLLASKWLARHLSVHDGRLAWWLLGFTVWGVLGMVALQKLGIMTRHSKPLSPRQAFVLLAGLWAPALGAFTLLMVGWLAAGDIATDPELGAEEVRARFAWAHAILLLCLAAWGALLMLGWRSMHPEAEPPEPASGVDG